MAHCDKGKKLYCMIQNSRDLSERKVLEEGVGEEGEKEGPSRE